MKASTYFWDADGGGATLDYGSGTISPSVADWWLVTSSSTGTYNGWTNVSTDVMQIGSSGTQGGKAYTGGATAPAFTLTLGGSTSLGQIVVSSNLSSGNAVTITDGGNAANVLSFGGAASLANQSATPLIIDAQILSTATLIDASSGTVVFTRNNGNTGGMTIEGSGNTAAGGTLQVGNGGTTGSLGVGSVAFVLNTNQTAASTLNFDRSDAATISNSFNLFSTNTVGAIIQQSGSNTLTLSGAVTLNNASAALTYNIGSTGQATDTEVSGVISGSGAITKTGAGTLLFSATDTYTGATTISAGTLVVGGAGKLGGGSYAGNISNSGTFTYSSSAAQTLSGVISGAGVLNKSGTSTLTLSGSDTYTGATTINSGNVTLTGFSSGGAVQGSIASSNVTVNSGGTLQFGTANDYGNAATGSAPVAAAVLNNVTMNSGTFVVTPGNNAAVTSSNAATAIKLTGTLSLASGLDVISLNGATSRYTGLTTGFSRAAGTTLLVASPNTVGNNAPGTATSQNLLFTSGTTLTGGVLTGVFITQASATLDATTIATYNSTNGVTSGGVSAYTDGGTGTLSNLSAVIASVTSSGYTGNASGSANSLRMDGSLNLGGNTLTLVGGSIIARANVSITTGTLSFGTEGQIYVSNNTSLGTSDIAHTLTVGSVIAGSNGLAFTGGNKGQGTLILAAANTYTGTTYINSGTLQLGNAGASGSIAGNVSNLGALVLNRTDAYAFSGTVSGSGQLNQAGTGTTTLTAVNTYTGATTVSAGTLLINGSSSTGSTVTVNAGATLGGSGTIGGNVTVAGVLAPGNASAQITCLNNLSLSGTVKMGISNAATPVQGTNYDAVRVGGLLTYGGVLTLSMTTTVTSGTYNLFDGLGSQGSAISESGDFSGVSFAGGAYAGTFTESGGVWTAADTNGSGQAFSFNLASGDLTVVAVPEPSAWALCGVGLMALVSFRKRSRKN